MLVCMCTRRESNEIEDEGGKGDGVTVIQTMTQSRPRIAYCEHITDLFPSGLNDDATYLWRQIYLPCRVANST
jgi:hypothetical protein